MIAKSKTHSDVGVLESRNNQRPYVVQAKILTMERMRNSICSKTLKICSEQFKCKIGNFQCHLKTGPFIAAFHIYMQITLHTYGSAGILCRYYQLIGGPV
jgi:hypothetical protein